MQSKASSPSAAPTFAPSTPSRTGQRPSSVLSPVPPSAQRPVGDPPVTELRTDTPSHLIRSKHRASQLIQRYSGTHWREASRTAWLIDVVLHIDRDYREYIEEQTRVINRLHRERQHSEAAHQEAMHEAQDKVRHLEDERRAFEHEQHRLSEALLASNTKLRDAEDALATAEAAAGRAAAQLAELTAAFDAVTEYDAKTRKKLANRAFEMRDALLKSQAVVRQGFEARRKQKLEMAAALKAKDNLLDLERAALQQQYQEQLDLATQAERHAGRVAVEKSQLELEAYKEPWMYLHGTKSPTWNLVSTHRLGLQQESLHALHVPY